MFGSSFRSEKAKTATVIGLTFLALPILGPALVFLLMSLLGGGQAAGYMIAFFIVASSSQGISWVIWLPMVIGIVFLLLAISNERDARRRDRPP